MLIEITKGQRDDAIRIERSDGTAAATRFPKKGPVPHDAVHFFVERELGLRNAFWGKIATGAHPEDLAALAKASGHASASRAGEPDASIVELLQAERMVEGFEAELWSDGDDDDALLTMVEAGCAASYVPLPGFDRSALGTARRNLRAFAKDWMAAPVGHVVQLDWV